MKTKIMVVDDDPNIRELVRLYLEKEGFEVTCAERGDEAVKAFRAAPPNLMLLDVMLPGMDGLAGVPRSAQNFQHSHHHAHRQG